VRSIYAKTARKLVYDLKFERAKASAKLIAELLDEAIPYLPDGIVISYVPTATSRVRLRGYDQAQQIARELSRLRSLPLQNLFIRHGQTRQVRSNKKTRAAQADKAYSLKKKQNVAGKQILVVDDIMTTAATLEAVARILKKAGAKQVNAAVFAQKQ
jgi:competence protein ComFC